MKNILFLMLSCTMIHGWSFECRQLHRPCIKETILTQKSHIAIIEDSKGDTYLVKQNKQMNNGVLTTQGQFYTVRELYGSFIAQYLGLRGQQVSLIPLEKNFIGKEIPHRLATLHKAVPGISIKKNPRFKHMSIKQWAPGRKLFDKDLGLNERVIKSMTMHMDLPEIVALDTFVGNNDRSKNNVWYEPRTNHFYIIDMDCSLSYNMAHVACEQLMRLDKTKHFSLHELIALKRYADALQRYVKKCSLTKLYDIFDEICQECGFYSDGVFADYMNLVTKHRTIIKENYQDILQVIVIANYIYKKHIRGKVNMRNKRYLF